MLSQIAAMRRSASCAGRFPACRRVLVSTSALTAVTLIAVNPAGAQTAPQTAAQPPQQGPSATGQNTLPQIQVSGARLKKRGKVKNPQPQPAAVSAPNTTPVPPNPLAGVPVTPLNNVATSASRLGLPVLQTPASVDIVTQQTMQDQGYRTTAEIGKGAVGVLDLDSSGAPANFSMRGFTFGEVNVLYNGISIGVASDTTRVMDTYNLDQVEFLKGPSALMSGIMAIGGAVNYVSRQPTTGPIQNELDASVDSYGSFRSHYGSGGSTLVQGLDYRVDLSESKLNSFIDGDWRALSDFSSQLNYRMTDTFKTFVALEYKKTTAMPIGARRWYRHPSPVRMR